MKRLLIPLLVLCLVALAVPAFAQVELGISYTPVPGGQGHREPGNTTVDTITGIPRCLPLDGPVPVVGLAGNAVCVDREHDRVLESTLTPT